MDKVLKGHSFAFEATLKYKDGSVIIDLDDVTDVTILIRKHEGSTALVTKKYSTGGVSFTTPNSGVCTVYMNPSDTSGATVGQYDYAVIVEVVNANYDSNTADFPTESYLPAFELTE